MAKRVLPSSAGSSISPDDEKAGIANKQISIRHQITYRARAGDPVAAAQLRGIYEVVESLLENPEKIMAAQVLCLLLTVMINVIIVY